MPLPLPAVEAVACHSLLVRLVAGGGEWRMLFRTCLGLRQALRDPVQPPDAALGSGRRPARPAPLQEQSWVSSFFALVASMLFASVLRALLLEVLGTQGRRT